MSSHPLGQTEEQRQAAFAAADLSTTQKFATEEGISAPGGALPLPATITTAELAPTETPVTEQPEEISIPQIPEFKEEPQAAVPKPVTDFDKQLSRLESAVGGVETFDVEQQTAQRTQQQQRQLIEINKRIGLQRARAFEAEERALKSGRTLSFSRGEAAITRREAAIEALTLSAQAQAIQGNLLLARDLAQDAIKAEFGQLEQDARVARQNILNNFKSFSSEQKKRAESTLARLDAEDAFLKARRAEKQQISDIAINAALKGAPADILDKIQNSEDAVTAASLAAPFLQKTTEDKLLSVSEAKALKVPFGTTQEEAFGITPQPAGALEGLSPAQQNAAFKLADDFEKASKEFFKVRDAFNRINASASDPSAAGDVAVVFNFMKMLDPGSVVRESEFALAANTGSLKEALQNKFGKLATGEILSFTREDFVDRAGKLFNAALTQQKGTTKTFADRAEAFGVPSSFVVRDIEQVVPVADLAANLSDEEAQEEIRIAEEEASSPGGTLFGNFFRSISDAFGN